VQSLEDNFPVREFETKVSTAVERIIIGAEQLYAPWVEYKNTYRAQVLVSLDPAKLVETIEAAAGDYKQDLARSKVYKRLRKVEQNYNAYKRESMHSE
jgi:hypothetical protein